MSDSPARIASAVKRRAILIAAGTWPAVGWPTAGIAQPKKPAMIGVLTFGTGTTGAGGVPAFREELSARDVVSVAPPPLGRLAFS